MDKKKPEYLGDGVYAEFDGFHVILKTVSSGDPNKPDDVIYLELKVALQVMRYLKWVFELE